MKTISAILMTFMLVAVTTTKTVYDFKVKDIDGADVSLSKYSGQVLLIINVASLCGNTPQYSDIEAIYKKYKDKGLVILGFPANNFMGQEPGSNTEIKQFCTSKYAVTFPMFSKISVKGSDIAPLYSYLTKKSENGVIDAEIKWNFQKFLVGRDGRIITSFTPKTKVTEPEVISAVEKALASK
jgi:glutathione peroxidase